MMKTFLIILTWFGTVPQMEQEIEQENLRECNNEKTRIEQSWAGAPREFVGVMVCEEIEAGEK